jgi:hypothetical protein
MPQSHKEGEFRVVDDKSKFRSLEDLEQMTVEYYITQLDDYLSGRHKANPLRSFDAVAANYQRIVEDRIVANIAEFRRKDAPIAMAMIPRFYRVPHPTKAQQDAFVERWDGGGDLFKAAAEIAAKAAPGKRHSFMPFVTRGAHPKMPVMVAIWMIEMPETAE